MKRIILAIFAFFILANVNAQEEGFKSNFGGCFHCPPPTDKNDWGLINQLTFSSKFNENVKGEINFQTRLMEDFTSLQALMIEPGIKVKLDKHFAFKSALRYSRLPSRWSGTNSFRIHMAGYYVWHKEGVPIRIQVRTRAEREDYFFFRNRLKVAFNYRDVLKPYTSFEVFNQFGDPGLFDLYRYEAGIKWEMLERSNITFMYRLESDINSYYISNKSQVLGVMINYSLGSRKEGSEAK
ncbi:MAG: DUF2490 domain-containing protein [Flavobacteriales bacterium]|nr:DUF2490 domain-containing protein [Flavobacteriales bacterium]